MTARSFKRLALCLPDVVEGSHHGHVDFRTGGKVFATLGYPDALHGMVVLRPEEQASFLQSHAKTFVPAAGAWGARGSTLVTLAGASEAAVKRALALAHKRVWRQPQRPR